MMNRSPMFSALMGPKLSAKLPMIAGPEVASQPMTAAATPTAPTGAYKMKPETRGKLISAIARTKDPLSGVPQGEVVSAIAKGSPASPDAKTRAAEVADKKRRKMAAQMGVLKNQAVNKPPVLVAPGTSTGATPSTMPSASRLGMINNRII